MHIALACWSGLLLFFNFFQPFHEICFCVCTDLTDKIINLFFSNFLLLKQRGEKLYVTKDKRLKSNWRKKLCWAIGLGLLALALLVGILAACKYFLKSI